MNATTMSLPERIRAYMAACPGAVSGQDGHGQTFTVAVALVNGFELNESDALAYLQEYNQKCSPPWSERELQHKIQSAITSDHGKPRGHLIGDKRPAPGRHPTPAKPAAPAKPPPPKYETAAPSELPEPLPDGTRQLLRAAFLPGETISAASVILNKEGKGRPDPKTPEVSLTLEAWLAKLEMTGGDAGPMFPHSDAGPADGVFVRINPVTPGGNKDADVTAFRHTLLEFDKLGLTEQWNLYQQSDIPCTAILSSGGKSIHAWVRVDAKDRKEYDASVAILYDHFAAYGIDPKNKNPSRYSRMPGVKRGSNRQSLLAVNVGAPSFAAWRADRKREEEARQAEINDPLSRLSSPKDEQGMLGCLIRETELAVIAVKKHSLTGNHFYRQTNRIWFDRLMDLNRRGVEITLPNAAAQFNGDLQKYGGLAYFDELKSAAENPYSADSHIPKLKELHARRLVVRTASQASLLAYDLAVPSDRLLADFKQTVEIMVPERGGLPSIVDASSFLAKPLIEPKQLIHGILHQGSKMVLGGGSKSFKTWQLLDIGLSVAHQRDWLTFQTCLGKVLYVNFEIQDFAWQARLRTVAQAKGIEIKPGMMTLWNLRGYASDYRVILPKINEAIQDAEFSLIILDPAYKLYGEADENSAGDIAGLCNAIELLAVKTGAAVLFGAHFSKGNQSTKEAIDRISGSGVFARDPDTLITLTRHEEDACFALDPILRNFKPVEPFTVKWQFPLMSPVDFDPTKLKKIAGRPASFTATDLFPLLPDTGLSNQEWAEAADKIGISNRSFYRLKKDLQNQGRILLSKIDEKWKPINLPKPVEI